MSLWSNPGEAMFQTCCRWHWCRQHVQDFIQVCGNKGPPISFICKLPLQTLASLFMSMKRAGRVADLWTPTPRRPLALTRASTPHTRPMGGVPRLKVLWSGPLPVCLFKRTPQEKMDRREYVQEMLFFSRAGERFSIGVRILPSLVTPELNT